MAETAEREEQDDVLTEAELSDQPLVEASTRVIVPAKGKLFDSDGAVKVAIIRPCVSRGRRIKSPGGGPPLPPIYEAKMLARHAGVFEDWPMFMDHVPPAVAEELKKRGRGIRELGGRIVESYFDPEFTTPQDDERGYKPGGVLGRAIPQPVVRQMIEADPGVLHVSINAWPTGARKGTAYGQTGMLIEGIRRVPTGSVDWVVRGGAGGRVLTEDEELLVSLVESYYDDREMAEVDLSKLTATQLREHIEANVPELAEQLQSTITPSGRGASASGGISLSQVEDLLDRKLTETRDDLDTRWDERSAELREEADERERERAEQRAMRTEAHALIEAAEGIPDRWKADLKARYDVTPTGPTPALANIEPLTESEDGKTVELDAQAVLERRVNADLDHSRELLREAQGKPRVTGEGPGDAAKGTRTKTERKPYWSERFAEMGIVESEDKAVEIYGGTVGG